MRTRLCLLAALGACQPNQPPAANQQPPANPTPPTTTPGATSSQPTTKSARPKRPLAPPKPAVSSGFDPGPHALTAVDDGALLVWSRHDATSDRSELLAVLLDADARVQGQPRLVRRTSGRLLGLDVHHRDGAAWLTWLAQFTDRNSNGRPPSRALVAAMQLEPDLSASRSPITLDRFVDAGLEAWPDRTYVRALDLADGDALVIAATAASDCEDTFSGTPSKCPAFNASWVRQDGASSLAKKLAIDGGEPAMGSLVDTGTAIVFNLWAWHGGAMFTHLYAPYHAPATDPPFPLHDCRPPFTRSWTGNELVTICRDHYTEQTEACTLNGVPAEPGTCTLVHTTVTTRAAVPLLEEKTLCVDGRPVTDLRWKDGALRLDPTVDRERGVWTGKYAVKLTADRVRELWTCNDIGEFVQADPPDDQLPFDPDTAELVAIPVRSP